LDSLQINPFNCRICYGEADIARLAHSLEKYGQLSPIKVRRSPIDEGKYEVIYGHRRCLAAEKLGWKQIRAEVISASDTESIEQSLIENLEREDLSDYEKATIFYRLNTQFGKTYDEIGRVVGLSKQRISSYVAMTKLFSSDDFSSHPELRSAIFRLDEHHARVLSTVSDREARIELAMRTVKEGLSVREVSNIVFRLRSWFRDGPTRASLSEEEHDRAGSSTSNDNSRLNTRAVGPSVSGDNEKEAITQILSKTLNLDKEKDSNHFESFHLFNEGYSQFSYFPPMNLLEQSDARSRSLEWFGKVSTSQKEILEQKIDIVGDVAVAALVVKNIGTEAFEGQEWITRGTIVLVKKKNKNDVNGKNRGWRTLHEHWSLLDEDKDRSAAKSLEGLQVLAGEGAKVPIQIHQFSRK